MSIFIDVQAKICKKYVELNVFDVIPVHFFRGPNKTFNLSDVMSGDSQAISSLLSLFQDEQQGLSFVRDAVLPEYSFIAIEAVWWCIEHCDDIQDEQTAFLLFQVNDANCDREER